MTDRWAARVLTIAFVLFSVVAQAAAPGRYQTDFTYQEIAAMLGGEVDPQIDNLHPAQPYVGKVQVQGLKKFVEANKLDSSLPVVEAIRKLVAGYQKAKVWIVPTGKQNSAGDRTYWLIISDGHHRSTMLSLWQREHQSTFPLKIELHELGDLSYRDHEVVAAQNRALEALFRKREILPDYQIRWLVRQFSVDNKMPGLAQIRLLPRHRNFEWNHLARFIAKSFPEIPNSPLRGLVGRLMAEAYHIDSDNLRSYNEFHLGDILIETIQSDMAYDAELVKRIRQAAPKLIPSGRTLLTTIYRTSGAIFNEPAVFDAIAATFIGRDEAISFLLHWVKRSKNGQPNPQAMAAVEESIRSALAAHGLPARDLAVVKAERSFLILDPLPLTDDVLITALTEVGVCGRLVDAAPRQR